MAISYWSTGAPAHRAPSEAWSRRGLAPLRPTATNEARAVLRRVQSAAMTVVLGYLIAASVAVIGGLLVTGRGYVVRPDPEFDIHEPSGRLVGVLGALAGFAVTGIVFLVTQAHAGADPASPALTTVLALFVLADFGYISSMLLFANVAARASASPFDLRAAQYAGGYVTLSSTVFVGWFALRALFETFGLTTMAGLMGWFLIAALVGGFGLLGTALYRTGYATARTSVLLPLLALIVVAAYGFVVGVVAPALGSADATLTVIVLAFGVGGLLQVAMTALPIAAGQQRLVPTLLRRWHLVVIAYAESAMVIQGLLLLSAFDLA